MASKISTTKEAPVILITGAAKRIGAAIARHFHRRGYDIIIHFHNSVSEAEALSFDLNLSRAQSATTLQAPLDDIAKVETLAKDALAWKGRLNVLVNNASSFYPTPLGQTTEQQWDALLGSNVKGAYFLTQALAPALKESNGCVINLADIYADSGLPDHSPYAIAKAGVKMMTKTLARELAPNVRVNGISPGAILWPDTPCETNAQKLRQERILQSIPLARLGSSEDIANTAWFLATHATYLTGQTIRVDGGRNLGISL